MLELLKPALEVIAEGIDLIGIAIVLLGAIKFLIAYVGIEARRLAGHECSVKLQETRLQLGSYILVSLEFLIVSDVIATVSSRSLDTLVSLAAIVVLRTAMGFFLERELREDEPERKREVSE